MENQSRSGLSASACFLQKAESVLRLNTRIGAQIPCSHFGINPSVRQGPLSSGEAPRPPEAQNHGQTRRWLVPVPRHRGALSRRLGYLCLSMPLCLVLQRRGVVALLGEWPHEALSRPPNDWR
jgi:hypothetical protein